MVLQTMHSMTVNLLTQIDHQDLNSMIIPRNNDLAIIITFSLSNILP